MKIIFFIAYFLFSLPVFSLTPPLSEAELVQQSTHIVEGRIKHVEKSAQVNKTECVDEREHKATLEVIKTVKGPPLKTLTVLFQERTFKKGCTGDVDALHTVGDSATYYLTCENQICRVVHWSGVKNLKKDKVENRSKNPLMIRE